jgi:hypothetical protein
MEYLYVLITGCPVGLTSKTGKKASRKRFDSEELFQGDFFILRFLAAGEHYVSYNQRKITGSYRPIG